MLQLPDAQRPQYITLNRWNYAVGWKEQPQEGLSRASSTFIEPSLEAGFSLYNAAAQLVHNLTGSKSLPPAAPKIATMLQAGSDEASNVQLVHPLWTPGEFGAPTEVCFYSETDHDAADAKNDRCGENTTDWIALNYNHVTTAGREHGDPSGKSRSDSRVCAVTRNFNGRSPTTCVSNLAALATESGDSSRSGSGRNGSSSSSSSSSRSDLDHHSMNTSTN